MYSLILSAVSYNLQNQNQVQNITLKTNRRLWWLLPILKLWVSNIRFGIRPWDILAFNFHHYTI